MARARKHGKEKHQKDKKKRNRDETEEDIQRNEMIELMRDDSEDEDDGQSNKRKKQKSERPSSKPLNFDLPTPDWSSLQPFKRNIWSGPSGEENPSEELKLLRKSIGVNVKGNVASCPPPVLDVQNEHLPAIFATYFTSHSLTKPTTVQQQCWPCLLTGANVLGIAPTGSGKTLAYLLPAYCQIESMQQQKNLPKSSAFVISPTVLVLVPTRELAIQVHSVCKSFKSLAQKMKSGLLYGGQEKENQLDELTNQSAHLKVLIATPGRLIDLLGNNASSISLKSVTYVVIDEADRMLSLGFAEQLTTILSQIRPDKQIVLFSATFPGNLRQLSDLWAPHSTVIRCNAIDLSNIQEKKDMSFLLKEETDSSSKKVENEVKKFKQEKNKTHESDEKATDNKDDANEEEVAEEQEAEAENDGDNDHNESTGGFFSSITISPTVNQLIHICAPHKRPRLLIKYIERIRQEEKETKQRQASPIIIFCNKITTLTYVLEFLEKQQLRTVPLHGKLPQKIREENLQNLKAVSLFSSPIISRNFLTLFFFF
jgi:superfamily II DNA/RNA helicase